MRTVPLIFLGVFAATSACSYVKTHDGSRVLLISVDSLRYDAISRSVGAASTPNIQRLLEDGDGFASCFSHSPDDLPAMAALLSARAPHESGITNSAATIGAETTLVAEHLKDAGYTTIGVFASASSMTAAGTAGLQSLGRGFDVLSSGTPVPASADEVNRRALEALASAPADKPWFAFVEYAEPAAPFEARGSAQATATIELDGKRIDELSISDGGTWEHDIVLPPGAHELAIRSSADFELLQLECRSGAKPVRPAFSQGRPREAVRELRATLENSASEAVDCSITAWIHDVPATASAHERYRLEVEAVDRAIGELLDALAQRGDYDKTLVVVTANHGQSLGEHGRAGTVTGLYDEMLRIPLIIKPPRGAKAAAGLSKLTQTPLRQIDIVPTALELAGAPKLPGASGLSVREGGERPIVSLAFPPGVPQPLVSLRDERFKMILDGSTREFEMYEVQTDTLEADNVFELKSAYRVAWKGELQSIVARAPRAPRVGALEASTRDDETLAGR